MRILIAGSVVANETQEEVKLITELVEELKGQGHTVDSFLLPFTRNYTTINQQLFSYTLFDTSAAELLITMGYPACMLTHPNKVCYLLERSPQFHEYWNTEYGVLYDPQYERIRETLLHMEKTALAEAKKLYVNSDRLKDDLAGLVQTPCERLYCPLLKSEAENIELPANVLATETCLLPHERPELLLELAKTLEKEQLYVFVPEAEKVHLETFLQLLHEERLEDTVKVVQSEVPETSYARMKAYVVTELGKRKISNSLRKSLAGNVPVIYAKDSGASEILKEKGTAFDAAQPERFGAVLKTLSRKNHGWQGTAMSDFAEKLVNL